MKVRRSSRIRHRGKLIADGIEPFLTWLLRAEEGPVAVELGGEVVKVPYMAGLLVGEFGQGLYALFDVLW